MQHKCRCACQRKLSLRLMTDHQTNSLYCSKKRSYSTSAKSTCPVAAACARAASTPASCSPQLWQLNTFAVLLFGLLVLLLLLLLPSTACGLCCVAAAAAWPFETGWSLLLLALLPASCCFRAFLCCFSCSFCWSNCSWWPALPFLLSCTCNSSQMTHRRNNKNSVSYCQPELRVFTMLQTA